MPIQLIDYVLDSKLENGVVFNGLTLRVVGNDILFDFAAINPSAALILDPENTIGIGYDEILVDKEHLDKKTVNHELNEDRGYWQDDAWEVDFGDNGSVGNERTARVSQ